MRSEEVSVSRHRPLRFSLLPAALCVAFSLSSCSALPAQSPSPTDSRHVSASPTRTPDGGSTEAVLSTFSGTWEDVQYSFDYPSDWRVRDSTVAGSPGSGVVTVLGPDGQELASLSILLAWGSECPCVERPAVHLGDVPGKAPLSKSGPFVARSVAMDLTDFPQDRADNLWADNVQVVTSLTGAEVPVTTVLTPQLMYGVGLVETGVLAITEVTHRTVLFIAAGDFGTMDEARAYAATAEHRKIQQMIASFREGRS